jgi:hypothetical protein
MLARAVMNRFGRLLVLAAACAIASAAGGGYVSPPRVVNPIAVSLKLVDTNEVVSGKLTRWDREELSLRAAGDAERSIRWRNLLPQQAYEVRRRVFDSKSAEEWLDLGALMLAMNARALSEQAFAQAVKLDAAAGALAEHAKSAAKRGEDPQAALYEQYDRREADRQAEEEAKRAKENMDDAGKPDPRPGSPTPGPGGGTAPPDDSQAEKGAKPWPAVSAEEQAAAMSGLRQRIDAAFLKHGVRLRTKESEHFILYSVMGDADTKRVLGLLETTYGTMDSLLGFNIDGSLFLGKCVVFVFAERDAFVEFELDFFRNPRGKMAGGYCHYIGAFPMLNFYRGPDEQFFLRTLVHEATHAVMYRFRTPAELPAWANEGLADFIAGQIGTTSNHTSEAWQHAKSFAMQNKDPMTVVRQSYEQGTWPNDDSYPMSHMMTRYLVKRDQAAYKAWIEDVKAGTDWEDAMASRFGAPPASVMAEFSKDMRAERAFTRVTLK